MTANSAPPCHRFIGEETYSKGSSRKYMIDDDPTWCVDPLDGQSSLYLHVPNSPDRPTPGTVNYIHLCPMYCVSIGFIVNGTPTVGVIYVPFHDTVFSACHGRGAWLNESRRLPLARNPIPPLPPNAPSGCIFSCEWGKDRRDRPDGNLHRKVETFVNMAAEVGGRGGKGGMAHGMRSMGR